MEYKTLTRNQIDLLEDAIQYSSSEDFNGSKGSSLADLLYNSFNGNPPKISELSTEKIIQYNIIASENHEELYSRLPKQKFKGIFKRLKEAGYKGLDGKGIKNYSKMSDVQMWNYFSEIRRNLNIFS